jgi:hypothetical protein
MQHSCAHCHGSIPLNRRRFGVILCLACEDAWMARFRALVGRAVAASSAVKLVPERGSAR